MDGHHSMKQWKAIRYGFKFWCLTTSKGYLLSFISPYCGAGDKQVDKTLGFSATEKLCFEYLPEGSTVYFLTPPAYSKITRHQLCGYTKSRWSRKSSCTWFKECPPGASHVIKDLNNDPTIVRWNDNNQVTVATNITNSEICFTKGPCKRWSSWPVKIYTIKVWGAEVNLFDKMRGLYRTIRSRKRYWQILSQWRTCQHVDVTRLCLSQNKQSRLHKKAISTILTLPPYLAAPKPKCSKNILKEVKYDGRDDHLIDKQDTQRRCGHCGKCTKFECIKWNVGLPEACFSLDYAIIPDFN